MKRVSAWSPLANATFRALWIAAIASNVGTWVQDVGEAWLMTSLSPSPMMVALVEAVTNLPLFLFALPAGALADVVDRRRLLLVTQTWMTLAAAGLALSTTLGLTTPWTLLLFALALGFGAAMNAPAWQATTPELVSHAELPAAVALNSVAINVSRALGPALGGLIVAASGPAAAFWLNSVSFVAVLVVLARWKPATRERRLPPEHMLGAMRAGVRYVRHHPTFRAVLVRAGIFLICGSAMAAILPILARKTLGMSAAGYGVLLGCMGIGALGGAAVLPRLRQKMSAEVLVAAATITFAAVFATLATVRIVPLLYVAMLAAGAAWLALLSSFNIAAQSAVAAWVRARALSIYLLVFAGALTAGSLLWGALATRLGVPAAFLCATGGLLVGMLAAFRYRLPTGKLDVTPSLHWPEPALAIELVPDQTPVLVLVEYRIDAAQSAAFAAVIREYRAVRLRDGALDWTLYHDAADPSRCIEAFTLESWTEHLRQHERFPVADREIETRVRAFHVGAEPPRVTHLLGSAQPLPPTKASP